MSRKKKSHRARAARQTRDLQPVAAPANAAPPGRRWTWLALGAVTLLLIGGGLIYVRIGRQSPLGAMAPSSRAIATPVAMHVGAQVCAECHTSEYETWQGSHHALAMQHANAQTVLGNFDHAQFTHAGITFDLLHARREVLHQHRRAGWHTPRLRDHVHLRGYASAAIPDRVPRWAAPGAHHRLGHAPQGGWRTALVLPLPRPSHPGRRPSALDRHRPELELHVRGVSLDKCAQAL